MVEQQIVARGITEPRVLDALRAVPRHRFVPAEMQSEAYTDGPLPIGEGQTISQPFVVAAMTDALGLRPQDRVYELGTGSGYQAAVASRLCAHVYTVEIHPALFEDALAVGRRERSLGRRIPRLARSSSVRRHADHRGSGGAAARATRSTEARRSRRGAGGPAWRHSGSPAHREVRRWQHDVAQAASRPLRAVDRRAVGAASKTRARSPARRAPCTPLSSR